MNINNYNFQFLSPIILTFFIIYLLSSSIYNYIKIIQPIISLKYKINISPKFVGEVKSELKEETEDNTVPLITDNTLFEKEQTPQTTQTTQTPQTKYTEPPIMPTKTTIPTERIITMKDVGPIIIKPAPTTNIFKSLIDNVNKLNYNNYKIIPQPTESFQTFSYSTYNKE